MSRASSTEIDPYAAAWLRNLIAGGHIAPGDVDERSIADVHPSDLKGYTQCHFFAGIGVWSYALRLAGWPDDRPVWTGSCPCQPFSTSGRGEGFSDERHLWPALHHLISQCDPPEVFGEQVDGKRVGPWLDLVQADMEGIHYAFGAAIFPAAGVGAPHRRHRTYFVAYAESGGIIEGRGSHGGHLGTWDGFYDDSLDGLLVQPLGTRLEGHGRNGDDGNQPGRIGTRPSGSASEASRGAGLMADSSRSGAGRNAGAIPSPQGESEGERFISGYQPDGDIHGGAVGELADAGSGRAGPNPRNGSFKEVSAEQGNGRSSRSGDASWDRLSSGELADSAGHRRGEERPIGRGGDAGDSAQGISARSQPGSGVGELADGQPRPGPTNGFWRDPDWLFCRDGKWRPVKPGSSPLSNGSAPRMVCVCSNCKTETVIHEGVHSLRKIGRGHEERIEKKVLQQGMLQAASIVLSSYKQKHRALQSQKGGGEQGLQQMRKHSEFAGPPSRSEPFERPAEQSGAPLPKMPSPRASRGDPEVDMRSVWDDLYSSLAQEPEQDLFCPVCEGMGTHQCFEEMGGSRVGMLKAYGNAIVAEQAAAFIRSYMMIGKESSAEKRARYLRWLQS